MVRVLTVLFQSARRVKPLRSRHSPIYLGQRDAHTDAVRTGPVKTKKRLSELPTNLLHADGTPATPLGEWQSGPTVIRTIAPILRVSIYSEFYSHNFRSPSFTKVGLGSWRRGRLDREPPGIWNCRKES